MQGAGHTLRVLPVRVHIRKILQSALAVSWRTPLYNLLAMLFSCALIIGAYMKYPILHKLDTIF